MKPTIAKTLRRLIYALLFLLTICALALSVFISKLDLDDYRLELAAELSKALEQPVVIGQSQLTFNKGIALRFADLRIGPSEAPLVEVPLLTATLQIAPLLDRQLILDRVDIYNPRLQLWLPILNRPKRGTTHQLTDKLGIRSLTIHDASLKIHQRLDTGSQLLFSLNNLNTELLGWQANKTATLAITGQLEQPQQPAEILLNINLPSSPDPAIWRHEAFDYQLSIVNLSTAPLLAPGHRQLPANVNLSASLTGTPSAGAQIDARLVSTSGREKLFTLTGIWTSSPGLETVTKLSGDLRGLPLNGDFSLQRQAQQQVLAGRLAATDIDLSSALMKRWSIPQTDQLKSGRLERLVLSADKVWPAEQPMNGLPRLGAEITLTDLEWQAAELSQLTDFSAELALEQQTLTISNAVLVANNQPVFISAQIDHLSSAPQLRLKAELQAQLAELVAPIKLPADWEVSGAVPIALHLRGSLFQPSFSLQTDLSKSRLNLGLLLQKSAAQKSGLLLEGSLTGQQIQLDRLKLELPELTISGHGTIARDPKTPFFQLDIDPFELAGLQPYSPLLKKIRLQGTLQPTVVRNDQGLNSTLHLSDAGAHILNIVADLNQVNGTIQLNPQGMQFDLLSARLGESDFILGGQIDNWQAPQLDLRLHSNQVRAQDLIFVNQELLFYDLDGHLLIGAGGIEFNPVTVRLEQDTVAEVTGSVRDFKSPQVALDIRGEKANIDQVIQLFIGPPKRIRTAKTGEHKPVTISVTAKQGTIGALAFQNAKGLIKDHRGVLSIYPLTFQSHEGSCQTRVEFDRTGAVGLLKVSGHAEQLNASSLHQDMFNKRGLVSGVLRGDFYLEGTLNQGNFWNNAQGAIRLQIKDGTLRKFRGLARAFSLLNVSQLFAGNLPDMDREGMPFTQLEGTIQIGKGRAKTEDLRIISESMNMSLVGSQSLLEDSINYNLGVMPLRTVDKIITSIPIAGWILTGEDKALLTAYFKIEGSGEEPEVSVVPINSVSNTVFGILKRTVGLPGKLVKDLGSFFDDQPKKQEEADSEASLPE